MTTKPKKKTTGKPKAKKTATKPKTASVPKVKISKTTPPKTKVEKSSTKTEIILNALKQPDGATIAELAEAAKWKTHSVRGFLSTKKKKDSSFNIEKFTRTSDGKTAYKIATSEDETNG